MTDPIIHPIDLNFRGRSGTIGAYLVPHSNGCFLVETGPGSTLNALTAGISALGYRVQDVTDVFVTHIHLDHAGAAGWWASQGARIHVHQNGAPHLVDPSRLLSSARRLYGELMDELWGEFLPVPQDKLSVLQDRQIFQIGDLSVLALDVPGHAIHHLAYLVGDACFCGDIAGIRLNPQKFLSLPLPPPDLHIEQWRSSIHHIQEFRPGRIIPTHFGVYPDASWHLQAVLNELDEIQSWMEGIMPLNLPLQELRQQFISFEQMRVSRYGIDPKVAESQQIANPSFMSADGILRYWNKYRANK
jgi:glyoxylase-like metal-dependent hydrolase (beta-lactamase superfamily II)